MTQMTLPPEKSAEDTCFGPHLMMDCRGVSKDKCSDVTYIWQFLNDLPDRIGMTKIIQPYVFPYSGLVPEDKGVTGMVIIAESHLTYHSFTEKDYFFFDLFSCKPFNVEAVIQEVIKAFDVKHVELHQANRGRDFPRSENSPANNNVYLASNQHQVASAAIEHRPTLIGAVG